MVYDFITRTVARIIGLYDPERMIRYLALHHAAQRGYLAAKKGGPDGSWRTPHSTGAAENVAAWQAVTNKARDLARNNPYIVGARRRFRSNVVSEGVWPRPKIRKPGAKSKFDLDTTLNQDILDRWERWAPVAFANGDSLYKGQRTAANHFFDDGQFLIRRLLSKKWPHLRLELLECDHLDKTMDREAAKGQNRIVGGIELDGYNKPVKYYITRRHPAEALSETEAVDAKDIIHVFDRQRASEVTGICGYASVVQSIFRLNEYAYSTMDQARLANHFGIWVETPYPEDHLAMLQGDEKTASDGTTRRYKTISPASFHYGLPGEKVHQMRPEIPGSQYGPFMTKELQTTSVGAGVSYESISHDGSQTNFAGSRQLLLIERGYTRMALALFEEDFHSKVYRWFLEAERDFGREPLAMPGYDSQPWRYLRVRFSRPVQEWVDPEKDVNARISKIENGLSTHVDECEDMGQDYEAIIATQAYQAALRLQSLGGLERWL